MTSTSPAPATCDLPEDAVRGLTVRADLAARRVEQETTVLTSILAADPTGDIVPAAARVARANLEVHLLNLLMQDTDRALRLIHRWLNDTSTSSVPGDRITCDLRRAVAQDAVLFYGPFLTDAQVRVITFGALRAV